jgi:hypothetical protein
MYPRKKGKSKVYIAILLIVVLAVSTAAIIYYANAGQNLKPITTAIKAGDSFTYSIKGSATSTGLDSIIPEYFNQYNETDYFKVTITDVNGTNVSFDTQWRFLNGTEINEQQTIDLSNGLKSNDNGFWAIYASNLDVGDKLRPTGFDELTINKTDTQTYADSTRERNFFEVQNEFFDVKDPTRSTLRYDYIGLYFDRETGMLETLTNLQSYNNPQMNLIINWKLTDSNVWKVK